MRGRPAKPAALKALAGNPGKRPIKADTAVATGAAVAPKSLSKPAAAIWARVIGSMPSGVYAAADESLMAAYCEAVALHRMATTEAIKLPVTVGSTGQLTVSPWVKIQSDQARLIMSLGARLGLDPASRQSLNVEDSDRTADAMPFGIH